MKQPGLAIERTFITCMKRAWIKYFPVIFGIILLAGCNNNNGKAPAPDTDPVFQKDPNLKNITEQIKQSPKDATLYFKRGGVLHKMQLDSLAIKDYKTASSLDTNRAEYYSAVGDLLFENKDISGSVAWIQKAIAKNPNDRKSHLKIAKLFLYLKDYPKSFAEINIVLRQDVYNPEAYFLKGMLYKDAKDTAKAISNFQTAVQVSPDYKDAIIQLGLMYSAKKDPIALRYLDNAYKMDTTDVFPMFAIGVYYQDNKDYVKAKELYKKCILRDRHFADAYFNMGYILMQEDSVEKAFRQYDIVTKIDPRNPTAYFNRGLCSEIMDSMKKAVEDYKMALSLDPAYNSPKEALKRLKGK
ncbi:MAG: tetratricopeptide repeat protein [Chitinophagales bacterium]